MIHSFDVGVIVYQVQQSSNTFNDFNVKGEYLRMKGPEQSRAYLSFWGKSKADSAADSAGADTHPAPFHMLDVAAVAQSWLTSNDPFIPGVGDNARDVWPAIIALVALHDIGKFSLPFQAKRPDLWPAALGALKTLETPRHDTAGYALLRDFALAGNLAAICGDFDIGDIKFLARAVCGHHGSPPVEDFFPAATFNAAAKDAAAGFLEDLLALLKPSPLPAMSEDGVTAFSWWLAGLTVLADWIGSNESWFPYAQGAGSLAAYWPRACERAEMAVAQAGLSPAPPNPAPPLVQPGQATPVQAFVATMRLGDPMTPALIIVEDQTGSGKTEAGLILAHRLMSEKQARGVFIALPTMATANALHDRLSNSYRLLFAPGAEPSLVLAHGKRNLIDRFTAAMTRGARPHGVAAEHADETAAAQCAAWIGQDRRRAFMADFGVGTIDQALHGVLPTRHAPLRLFGLSQRVLIIDEAHAYDAYMQEELFRLVAFQTGLGGSIIILSATLPLAIRQKLIAVFHEAIGLPVPTCAGGAYPLITVAAAAGIREYQVAPRPGLAREMMVQRLDDEDVALSTVLAAAARGGAVAWIRNTVDDAVAAHAALETAGVDAMLFHARFAMGDRLDIETAVQEAFGKDSQPAQRARVVVGTQVLEQSLDIDFDVIVTDLAPVDLLLQRAGRLWRHHRPSRPEAAPALYVVAPAPVAEPKPDWLKSMRGTGFVYGDHALLWRTARVVFAQAWIQIPADVRRLVEEVYGADAPVPAGLAANSGKAAGQAGAARAIAWQNLLTWRDGYAQSGGAWASDVRTPTRLAEPGTTYRLAYFRDGEIAPCCAHGDKSWAMSEITLPAWRVAGVPADIGARAAAIQKLREGWGAWERDIPVLLLDTDGAGTVTDRNERPVAVRYTRDGGLVFSA
jgi:CRISPR-associated endonuclease/helicase Cas3